MKITLTNQNIAVSASIVGFFDSVYLAIEKLNNKRAMCIQGLGDCWSVNNSSYAQVFGIPVSIFGAIAYLILLFLLLSKDRLPIWKGSSDQLAFGVSLAGLIFSIYLTYLEIAVIKAVCPFCVLSAIMMVILFICTLLRLVNNQKDYKMSLEEKNG